MTADDDEDFISLAMRRTSPFKVQARLIHMSNYDPAEAERRAAFERQVLEAIPLREPSQFDLFSSTTSATQPTTLDLAAVEKLLADTPPEPIGEWMRQQGFPPETSLLILPETMREQLPPFAWPRYVRFSLDVAGPTLMRDVLAGHQIWQRYPK